MPRKKCRRIGGFSNFKALFAPYDPASVCALNHGATVPEID